MIFATVTFIVQVLQWHCLIQWSKCKVIVFHNSIPPVEELKSHWGTHIFLWVCFQIVKHFGNLSRFPCKALKKHTQTCMQEKSTCSTVKCYNMSTERAATCNMGETVRIVRKKATHHFTVGGGGDWLGSQRKGGRLCFSGDSFQTWGF